MKEVLYEAINSGEKDFSALVSKIKAAGADVVYWGGLHTEGGLIVRQMRDQGVKAVFMSGDGITSDEFASIGGHGVEGTLMTFGPDPRKNPAAAEVVNKFAAKNINPEAYTLYSYAAMQVIAMAAADGADQRSEETEGHFSDITKARATCTYNSARHYAPAYSCFAPDADPQILQYSCGVSETLIASVV